MNFIRIEAPPQFEIPAICVVCGKEADRIIDHVHETMPVVLPGVVSWKETAQQIPYCNEHATAFKSRWRKLRLFQNLMVIPGFILVMIAMTAISDESIFHDLRNFFGFSLSEDVALTLGVIGMGMVVFAGISFFIKNRLYDALIRREGTQLMVMARSQAFIDAVAENAKRANADESP